MVPFSLPRPFRPFAAVGLGGASGRRSEMMYAIVVGMCVVCVCACVVCVCVCVCVCACMVCACVVCVCVCACVWCVWASMHMYVLNWGEPERAPH